MKKIQIQKHNYLMKSNMIPVQMSNKYLGNLKYWTWKFHRKSKNNKENKIL